MISPRVELVCVGTELLMGRVNTHASTLSERLERLGLPLVRETSVSDDPREMASAFREVWARADVVIVTGGLGPTFDDRTRDVWARVTGRRLRLDRALADQIAERFRRRGIAMPPANRRQAQVLAGARILANENGTAPGLLLDTGRKVLALFPGPPRELHPMFDRDFLPFLRERFSLPSRETRVWRLFGLPESAVDQALRPLQAALRPGPSLTVVWGILAHGGVVDIKATASGALDRVADWEARADRVIRRCFGAAIFGTGDQTMEEVVGALLRRRGETVVVAESCTGGGLAERLTRVPGSSDYFREGWVTYANEAKTARLGVPSETLRRFGAVSSTCARDMAVGARRRARADWGVSLTGVAGPSGGGPGKPVGRVYIAWAGAEGVRVKLKNLTGPRAMIREQAVLWALDGLRRRVSSS